VCGCLPHRAVIFAIAQLSCLFMSRFNELFQGVDSYMDRRSCVSPHVIRQFLDYGVHCSRVCLARRAYDRLLTDMIDISITVKGLTYSLK